MIYKGNDNYYLMGTTDHSGFPGGGGTFGGANANAFGTSKLPANTWSYLATTYDGANLRLYVNGIQVASIAKTGAITMTTNPLTIGSDPIWGQYFSGLIDDVRVYNIALTQAQIQTDMASPVVPAAPDMSPPSAPGALSATVVSASRVDLSWGAASDNVGVAGYHVERCQGVGCSGFVEIATSAGSTASYSDTTVAAGISYSYRVRANDATPNLGPYSNTATALTPSPDMSPPSAPGALSATVVSASRVDLSWGAASDNVGVAGYHVERCQGVGCSGFVEIATSAGSTASYSDTTVAAGISYSYRVRANDATPNLGPYSNTATALTPSPDMSPPSAPGALSATVVSASRVDLSWGAASDNVGVAGYHVERCQGVGCSGFVEIATSAGSTASYSDTTVAAGISYSYRVRANDATPNLGPYSNTATTATPVPSGPSPVAAFSFDEGAGSTVADASGSGNNGALANTSWAVAGKYGKALSFNGTSSRVTVPNAATLQLGARMTLEAWVSPTVTSAAWRDVIYKGNDNYYLMGTTDNGGRPGGGGTFGGANANAFGSSTLPTNTWSYLATSYDGANLRLYVNGTLVATLAKTGAITATTNPLTIGSDPIWGQYFSGLIDDVRVYNIALTQAQIQTDMGTPVAPPAPDTSPPSAPGTLSAIAVSSKRVDLSWGPASDNIGVAGYHVERCQGVGCSGFAEIATTAATVTGYSDTTAAAGTSYSYRVRANDAVFNLGAYSNTAAAITPSPDLTPPSAPGTLSATTVSSSRIDLGWAAAADDVGVAGYHVERCQGVGCSSFAAVATIAGTATGYSDITAAAGTTYGYRVRANDADGNLGPYSNTATAISLVQTGFQIVYRSTDTHGVVTYDVTSPDNGYGTQVLRVLSPTNPAPGVPHNFLYVLPVEAGLATTFGDGLETLRGLDAQDQYNLTIVEPSFAIEPWYADNPNDANLQYETFMTKDLLPWVTQTLALTSHEQNWLIGFSKSGIGGEDLILKHPDLFTLAASWDFPADMSTYDQYGSSSASSYGSDANFQANYRLTPAFVDAHKTPFLSNNRIWIGGYQAFQADMTDYDALLTADGIAHQAETPILMAHRWDSGWVPVALAALHQASGNLPSTP